MKKLTVTLQNCLALSPLFLLTLSGWISGILFISCLLAILVLYAMYQQKLPIFSKQNSWLCYFAITFTLPTLAIFLGQFFRLDFAWRDYDSPARFLLCIPILLVIVQNRFDILKQLTDLLPCALFITLISIILNPHAGWVEQRISTYFVDPLTFGSLNLTLGLCCLLSIDLYQHDLWRMKIYKTLGFVIGVYLSVLSGSRTGWLALPIVFLLWLNFRMTKYRALPFISVLLLVTASYYFSDILHQRLDLAVEEITTYRWNSLNTFNSVGARISFLRMAVFAFLQNPLAGFGDQGFAALINHPELNRFAPQETQLFALHAGFHNEIATNMVRSGLWGLLSSCSLFIAPAIFFIGKLRCACLQTQKIALLAFGYLLCTFISGMTTEVFNLKFTASFHALMFTCLISSLLVSLPHAQEFNNNEST